MNIDIIDEIKKFKNDNNYIKDAIEHLKQQEEETKKHLYLFKVLKLIHEFDQLINTESFKKSKIKTAEIYITVKEDIGNAIAISCHDNQNMYLDDCYYVKDVGIVDIPEIRTINSLFENLDGLDRSYVGDKLQNNKIFNIN